LPICPVAAANGVDDVESSAPRTPTATSTTTRPITPAVANWAICTQEPNRTGRRRWTSIRRYI